MSESQQKRNRELAIENARLKAEIADTETSYLQALEWLKESRAELAAAREEIKALQKRVRGFAADVAKLRALCAARPKGDEESDKAWVDKIDAAGRGEIAKPALSGSVKGRISDSTF